MQQLDIFDHSHDAMLRNDAVLAVERRDRAAARAARQALAAACPNDDLLAPLDVLIGALDGEAADAAGFTDDAAGRDALCQAADALRHAVEPAARRLLGESAGSVWPAPLWRRLAERARALPWRTAAARHHGGRPAADRVDHADHAAALWLRAGDWQAAADAVAGIESWRRIPAPLAWMAEARCRRYGLDDAWPLLVELAWLAPARFDALADRLCDPLLARLRRAFGAAFEGDGTVEDSAWLPAWLLIDKPALAHRLALAEPSRQTAPEVAMRLLLELLGLERQGRHHELVDRRRALRDSHAGLYAAYMRTR